MDTTAFERLAEELVRRFGGGAAMEAGHLAEKARQRGDFRGADNWNLVSAIARRLAANLPSGRDSDFQD